MFPTALYDRSASPPYYGREDDSFLRPWNECRIEGMGTRGFKIQDSIDPSVVPALNCHPIPFTFPQISFINSTSELSALLAEDPRSASSVYHPNLLEIRNAPSTGKKINSGSFYLFPAVPGKPF